MTLLDRALTKAYSRRDYAARTVTEPQVPAPVTRGWVARLRPPSQEPKSVRTASAEIVPAPSIAAPERSIHDAHDRIGPHLQRADAQGRKTSQVAAVIKSAPPPTPAVPAEPVAWAWPAICDRLLSSTAGPGIRGLASLLCEMLTERRKRSLAFTGPGRGAGRTTLLLTMARLLAEDRQLRVLMIDLDFGNPQLTRLLGIDTEQDLWQGACGNVASAVPLVTLVPDRLSLAPLRDRVSMTELTADRTATLRGLMQKWRNEFDLVLVDGGPWELFGSLLVRDTATVEACVCVSHADRSTSGATDGERYRQAGMDFLGFIETFAPPDSQLEPPHTR